MIRQIFLTSIAALLLATGTARAEEQQRTPEELTKYLLELRRPKPGDIVPCFCLRTLPNGRQEMVMGRCIIDEDREPICS
jgi:hypothetical protein